MQVLNKFTILIIVINTISCTPGKSRFENEIFSFFYPKNWELKDYIISPYKGIITINDTDTLYYNIGMVVSNLSEECKEVFYVPNLDYLEDTSGSNALFTTRRDFDPDRYKIQSIIFEKKNHSLYKYTFPSFTGNNGFFGVYIDSLQWGDNGVVKFNAFIENVKKLDDKELLETIKTIELKQIGDYSFYSKTLYVQ